MKLVELECQNCGSALKVEEETNNITCPYCKATYKLDDEVQHVKYDDMENSGYEFEKGRIKAQKEHASSKVNTNVNLNVNSKFPKIALIPIFMVATVMIIIIVTSGISHKNWKNKFDNNSNSNSISSEKAKKELESKVYDFNWRYSSGKKIGASVKNDLNDVINSNRTNKERLITVKFNGIETQDSEEILKIIDQIDTFTDYNVLLDYDEDGFITVINIE